MHIFEQETKVQLKSKCTFLFTQHLKLAQIYKLVHKVEVKHAKMS